MTEEVVGERKRVDLQAAMKMINGALTKYPGNISLRSLKAHAWERAGNLVKALEVGSLALTRHWLPFLFRRMC